MFHSRYVISFDRGPLTSLGYRRPNSFQFLEDLRLQIKCGQLFVNFERVEFIQLIITTHSILATCYISLMPHTRAIIYNNNNCGYIDYRCFLLKCFTTVLEAKSVLNLCYQLRAELIPRHSFQLKRSLKLCLQMSSNSEA